MRLAVVLGILIRCVLGIQFIEPNANTVWSTEGPNTVSWAYNSSDAQSLQIFFQSDTQQIESLVSSVPTANGEYIVDQTFSTTKYAVVTFLIGGNSFYSSPFIIVAASDSTSQKATQSGTTTAAGSTASAAGSPIHSGTVAMAVPFGVLLFTFLVGVIANVI